MDHAVYGALNGPFKLIKRNKRLLIVDAGGRTIYTMPFFVRLPTREPLQKLCDHFNTNGYDIKAIIDMEFTYTNKLNAFGR